MSGGSGAGGGLYINGNVLGTTTVTKSTFIGNSTSTLASAGIRDGGGISVDSGNLTISFSRIVNNIANGGLGSGLFKRRNSGDAGTVTATNNWWGCAAGGPGAAPCDTAILGTNNGGSGTLTTAPFLRIKTTPNPIYTDRQSEHNLIDSSSS